MAVYNKFQSFVEDLTNKALDLFGAPPGDSLKVGLTNTSPNAADNVVDTSVTPDVVKATSNAVEIAAGNGYTEGGLALVDPQGTRASGTFTLSADSMLWTCVTAAMAIFRYVYLYDNTAGAAATRPVIGWWDYGSSITLQVGETFTINFNSDATDGTILTIV